MTDDRDPLERRLGEWFAAEVRRAERDLATGERPVVRTRRSRTLPIVAIAGVAVALVVGLVALRPPLPPQTAGEPTRVPGTAVPTATDSPHGTGPPDSTEFGADGLPTTIDGEPVVRIADLPAALAGGRHALVAGWHQFIAMRCAAPPRNEPRSDLLPWCNPFRLAGRRDAGAESIDIVVDGRSVPVGAVVLRVHDSDRRAADCPPELELRCQAAIVVDEVVWDGPNPVAVTARAPDGIPSELDGERVLRPPDLAVTDPPADAAFLLGGWHGQDTWFGCGRLGETHPLLDDCSPEWIADAPGDPGTVLMQARDLPDGPVVIRVHTNDPRSVTCPDVERVRCEERIVVDELIWSGDELTDAAPLTALDVAGAIEFGGGVEDFALAVAQPRDGDCDPGWPPIRWASARPGPVGFVLVYADETAAEAASDHFNAAGWIGTRGESGCALMIDGLYAWRWERVENVIVQFNVTPAAGTPSELDRIARIVARLDQAVP